MDSPPRYREQEPVSRNRQSDVELNRSDSSTVVRAHVVESDGVISASVEETNRVRALLGLKPLDLSSTGPKKEAAAAQIPETPTADEILGRVEAARSKRIREELVGSGVDVLSLFGESAVTTSDLDAEHWVAKTREAERQAVINRTSKTTKATENETYHADSASSSPGSNVRRQRKPGTDDDPSTAGRSAKVARLATDSSLDRLSASDVNCHSSGPMEFMRGIGEEEVDFNDDVESATHAVHQAARDLRVSHQLRDLEQQVDTYGEVILTLRDKPLIAPVGARLATDDDDTLENLDLKQLEQRSRSAREKVQQQAPPTSSLQSGPAPASKWLETELEAQEALDHQVWDTKTPGAPQAHPPRREILAHYDEWAADRNLGPRPPELPGTSLKLSELEARTAATSAAPSRESLGGQLLRPVKFQSDYFTEEEVLRSEAAAAAGATKVTKFKKKRVKKPQSQQRCRKWREDMLAESNLKDDDGVHGQIVIEGTTAVASGGPLRNSAVNHEDLGVAGALSSQLEDNELYQNLARRRLISLATSTSNSAEASAPPQETSPRNEAANEAATAQSAVEAASSSGSNSTFCKGVASLLPPAVLRAMGIDPTDSSKLRVSDIVKVVNALDDSQFNPEAADEEKKRLFESGLQSVGLIDIQPEEMLSGARSIEVTATTEFCRTLLTPLQKSQEAALNRRGIAAESFPPKSLGAWRGGNESTVTGTVAGTESVATNMTGDAFEAPPDEDDEDEANDTILSAEEAAAIRNIMSDQKLDQGLSSALSYLKSKGELQDAGWHRGRKNHENAPLHIATGENDIRLEYKDDFGRVMTPKDAFRYISWVFHGKGPGKRKREKMLRKLEEEKKLKALATNHKQLPTMRALFKQQKASGQAHLVLTSNSGSSSSSSVVAPTTAASSSSSKRSSNNSSK